MKHLLLSFFISLFFIETQAQCTPLTTFFEDFESYSDGDENPGCWSRISAPYAQNIEAGSAYSGNNALYMYTFFSTNDVSHWVSPEISTIDGNHYLNFWAMSTENASLEIGYSSSPTSGFVYVQTINLTSSYTEYTVNNIPAITGNGYIGFRFSSPSWHTANRIDDVSWLQTAIVCDTVENIQVNVIDTAATISWDAALNSSSYFVEYGLSGFSLGSGTTVNTTNTNITISALSDTTVYDFYVLTDCSSDSSNFTSVNNFTTLSSQTIVPCDTVSNIQSLVTDSSAIISWNALANGSMYVVEYGLSGFSLGSGTRISTTNSNISLSGLSDTTAYDFYILTDCGADSSNFTMVNSFTTLATPTPTSCDAVTDITITAIGEDSVSISWIGNSNAISYNIEYEEQGFSLGNGILLNTNQNSITITGLDVATSYDFYITTVCNSGSSLATTVQSFSTYASCVAVDTLFDDFESYIVGGLPNCWSSLQDPYAIGIRDTPNEAYSGDKTLFIYTFFEFNDITYLISPELNTIDGSYYADFYINSNFEAAFEYGTMSDNLDVSTYLPQSDWISIDSNYTNIKTENITATSGHKYFVIKTASPSQHTSIRIDDFLWAKAADEVGIKERNILDVNVYPNPSNGMVNINTTEEITQIKLYNILGNLVAEYNNEKVINVSHINEGIYFLELKTLESKSIVKLRID